MAVCDAIIILLQIYFHHKKIIVCAYYIHIACSKNLKLCHSTCIIFERPQCKLLQSCEDSKLFQSSNITAVISAVGQVLVNQT